MHTYTNQKLGKWTKIKSEHENPFEQDQVFTEQEFHQIPHHYTH